MEGERVDSINGVDLIAVGLRGLAGGRNGGQHKESKRG